MSSESLQHSTLNYLNTDVHILDWQQSILNQLSYRKSTEQTPFEEICNLAARLSERTHTLQSENDELKSELHSLNKHLLTDGTEGAKTLSRRSKGDSHDISHLLEKSQLEKRIAELEVLLKEATKSKSELSQKIFDLTDDLDKKDSTIKQLTSKVESKNNEIEQLKRAHNTLHDEHVTLTLTHKSLEKRNLACVKECDTLRLQLLEIKREDADRLNAENERELMDKKKKELEANIAKLTKLQLAKQAEGEFPDVGEDFDQIGNADDLVSLNTPSRIPNSMNFSFDAHEGETCAIHWYSRSGLKDDYLATGGSDRKVKIWKVDDGVSSLVNVLQGSNASIMSIDVEGEAILASSQDYATRVWSMNTQKHICLTGHSNKVFSAKFMGNPTRIASGSQDRTMKIWDVNLGGCSKTYFAGSSCYDLVYVNEQIISCHFDGKIRIWDLRRSNANEPTSEIKLTPKIISLDLSKDETKLVALLRENCLKLIDLRRMEVLHTYLDERFKLNSDHCKAKFSTDGQYVACGSVDGSLFIWDTETAKLEKMLPGANSASQACCWSPDGRRMASIDKTKKVSIWA